MSEETRSLVMEARRVYEATEKWPEAKKESLRHYMRVGRRSAANQEQQQDLKRAEESAREN